MIASGSLDPVGKMGKGVKRLLSEYLRRGFCAELKLYPELRHEMLSEKIMRQQVYTDIFDFLEKALQGK